MAFLGSSDNIELDLNLSSLKCSTLLFSIAPGREDLNTDNNTKNMSGKGRCILICSCDTRFLSAVYVIQNDPYH